MTFLLDVNAMIALGLKGHHFHQRLVTWLGSQPGPTIATSSITELGFLRILTQTGA